MKKAAFVGALLIAGILIGGLVTGLSLLKQQQLPEKQAAAPGGTATIKLDPGSASLAANQTQTISGKLNTGNAQVLGYQVIINFDYSTSSAPVEITSTSVTSTESAFNCLINSISHNASAKKYTLTLGCVTPIANPPTTYSSNGSDATIFTLDIKGITTGSLTYAFDNSNSYVTQSGNGQDILANPVGGSYYVGSDAGPTPTPYPTPTPPSIGGDGGPTPTPPAGATNACGGTCGSNANCNVGLTCSNGFCRNPSCSASANCVCSAATPTPTTTTTNYPTPTPVRRATPTPVAVVTYPTPTTNSVNNPFLGGEPGYQPPVTQASIPPLYTPTPPPVAKTNFFSWIINSIIAFIRSIFLRG